MGKQSRRKRQRSKRPFSSTTSPEESPSSLLQKLRHSDPQTCHAALIGLTCTLLHPEQLSSNTKRVVSSDILNTIRQLILHENLECAHAAATCCVNFLQYGVKRDKNELTAGWTLVLSQRLVSCQEAVSISNNDIPERKQWLAVTTQCLTALCALVERNPLALPYIQKDENAIHLVPLLLALVKFAKETLETASTNHTSRSEEENEYIRDIAIYSLCILHSALDDNMEMMQTWLSSRNAMEEWNCIHQACTCVSLPLTSRLHAAACLVTARSMCRFMKNKDIFANWTSQAVLETVLPLLQESIGLPSSYPVLLQESIAANALLQQQEEDVAMEENVIAAMDTKKESARDIAKRHAQLKQNNDTNSSNPNDAEEMKTEDTTTTTPVDGQVAWNQFQRKWHDTIAPIQLALELVTNVTSVEPLFDDDDHTMNEEEMEMAWGPEQEEALLMNNSTGPVVSTTPSCHPLDAALLSFLAQSGLGDCLLTLLQSVCSNGDEEDSSLPASVKQDVEDLQSKCAAALGNYLGNVTDWQIPTTLWKDLQLAAQSSTGAGTEGVFDVMAVAMQTRPLVRRQIQQEDLEWLMGQLSCTTGSTDKLKANVVSILGLLCSTESHPNQVNEKVCSGLLSLLQSSSSAMVLSDVFNALMDMYGDDGHVQVFESLHVLANFQRNVPRFKQRIQAERNKAPSENVQEWNETALNASRFISYKKGQL